MNQFDFRNIKPSWEIGRNKRARVGKFAQQRILKCAQIKHRAMATGVFILIKFSYL